MRVTDQAALWCVVTAPLWLAASASLTSGDAEAAAVVAPAAVAATERRPLIDTRSHDNGVERVGVGRRSIHHGTRSTSHRQKRLVKQHKLLVTRQSIADNSTGDGGLLGGLLGGSGLGSGSGSDTGSGSGSGSESGSAAGSGSGAGSNTTSNPLDNTTTIAPPVSVTTNNSTPTQTPNVTTAPAPAVPTPSNTTKAPAAPAATTTTTANHTKASSTPSSVPTSSSAPPTSTVTNTSQTSTSSSPTPTATTANDTANKSSSSGLSKTALIIIIAVASSVGFIGLVWTIIRKTAFGTSKRFDAKLEPIEWTEPVEQHHRDETYPYGSLGASGRNGSLRGTTAGASGASLGRSDSGKGSDRGGAMAEAYPQSIPYNGPAYVAAPYYGNAPANQYGARPGYPHEQASFGYADLQRGGSVATSVGSGAARAATPGGYDYAAQARAMHQPTHY
ncbi:BZ3500_MvSof-1268-A1-R1_Chr7-1g09277 [Microbotryum saponariae]|uniref:BZ3500_MvSof-1268-A1-R1_Chr7-1g09277 protein n=1 Tax=Microbotryum saponariae TaxID=289078 RepID=A0A2X0N7B2_9BASI|nr:BZ3501_MvSof-1269-A2-R1_Chr7-1g08982 [Microbotryum saponariae]SDA03142.1 BZ3500_MvSof-1268-A1-R1_Chr7-1g09277 [Microbotryum saponariae]